MVRWPNPMTVKELCVFLGLTRFYRKFIKGYAAIAAPLTSLLCKDAFTWTFESQIAFDQLKSAMTNTPVLALPNFSEPFVIETNASGTAIGAVLMQNKHPLAYFSKGLGPWLVHASTYIWELHAIVAVVRKWRQYLLGRSFTILTDHKSLRELMTQVIQTRAALLPLQVIRVWLFYPVQGRRNQRGGRRTFTGSRTNRATAYSLSSSTRFSQWYKKIIGGYVGVSTAQEFDSI